jgi:hypothetical protein
MGGGILCFGIVPAALAGAGNARLGGERRSIVRASVGAASICFVGVMVDAIVFLLTVPPGFFQ